MGQILGNFQNEISNDMNATWTELSTLMQGLQTDPFGTIQRLSNQLTKTIRLITTEAEQTTLSIRYGFVAMMGAILLSLVLYLTNFSPLLRVIVWTIYAGLCLHMLMTYLRHSHRTILSNSQHPNSENNPLLQIIIQSNNPTEIDLLGQKLNSDDMKIIVTQAMNKQKCKSLGLIDNDLTFIEISILSDGLMNNQTLKSLSLWKNSIGDQGVQFLSNVLSSNKTVLTKVDLSSNEITDLGAEYLSQMLRTNLTLTDLSLSNNRISDHGFELLIQSLKDRNQTIQVLSLTQNKLITDQSIESILDLFKTNRSLKKLWINNCNLSKKGREQLRRSKSKDFDLYT